MISYSLVHSIEKVRNSALSHLNQMFGKRDFEKGSRDYQFQNSENTEKKPFFKRMVLLRPPLFLTVSIRTEITSNVEWEELVPFRGLLGHLI